jgi:phosphohistidine phosphatase
LNIEWVWSSPSIRTKTTANSIFKDLDCEFFYLPALYLASFEELSEAVQAVPNEIKHLAIVGHNPGLSQLASFLLAKEHPQFLMNTMGLLSYDINGNFGALKVGCGELLLQRGHINEA